MISEVFPLRRVVPALGEQSDATVACYIPEKLAITEQGEEKHPGIIICPGGGYGFCSQREAEPVALAFLTEGYRVFVLNYSVAPRRYPTQLWEVAALLELIYQNADAWRCDVSRIALMGFSAGGHLAAHYANAWDSQVVRSRFPDSKPVQASLLCYPVITGEPEWRHDNSFCRLTGHDDSPADPWSDYSCHKMVRRDTPPAFLWHTSTDGDVPVMNSLRYAQALAENGVPFEMHIFPFGDHGLSTSDHLTISQPGAVHEYANQWISLAKKWLRLTFAECHG